MPGEPATRSELRASLSELELKLRIWAEERFMSKPLDELKIKEIARQAIEKEASDEWTGKSRFITLVLFVGSIATTITTLIVFFTHAI